MFMTSLFLATDNIEQLYGQVTTAIVRAEQEEAAGNYAQAASEYLNVSFIEEEIAKLLPASDPEGEIARRGVITAGMSAGQYARAIEMANLYLADSATGVALRRQLMSLRENAERGAHSLLDAPVLVQPTARFRLAA
jgi:hypothetical protein